jgi:small subunit ribosomal protein S3
MIRKSIIGTYGRLGVASVNIERAGNRLEITIHTSRPGAVIGRAGEEVEKLKDKLINIVQDGTEIKNINIQPIRRFTQDAMIVAQEIAGQLESKMPYRKACRTAMDRVMTDGAGGVKVQVGGRLGGLEIARSVWFRDGRIPLGTFRADIDYGFAEAHTAYGQIGVKVWIFHDKKAVSSEARKTVPDKEVIEEPVHNVDLPESKQKLTEQTPKGEPDVNAKEGKI